MAYLFSDGYNDPPPVSFMAGPSFEHHLNAQDQYSLPPSSSGSGYGPPGPVYSVQPPMGSDSGSSGYVPISSGSGSFSPVSKDYSNLDHQQQQQQLHHHHQQSILLEAWNNNERVETSFDCY